MYDQIFQESINDDAYSDSKTKALLRLIQNGDDAALESIVTENMPLVKSLVKRYINRGYEYEDLMQLGTIGLIKAAKNYNFNFDVRFSTYAVPMITGEIKRFLRDDGVIKISRSLKENSRAVIRARDFLAKELNREPSVTEISAQCGISPEDVVAALDAARPVISIYDAVAEDGDSQILVLDRIEQEEATEYDNIDMKILLTELLSSLQADDRKIIIMRYFNDMTQSEVAKRLNISQVQVSRIEKRILTQLRKKAVG